MAYSIGASPRIRLTTVTTDHPPAAIGWPMAAVGVLAGVIASRIFPPLEWAMVAAVAAVSALVGWRFHRAERRRRGAGVYRMGSALVYGSCYLLFLGVLPVLFGVGAVATWEPSPDGTPMPFFPPDNTFFQNLLEVIQALMVWVGAPLALAMLWLMPIAFVAGAAAVAGKVPPGAAERASADRGPWRAAAGVMATLSLLAWPAPGAGLAAALVRPGPVVAIVAACLAALVLVADLAGHSRLASTSAGVPAASRAAVGRGVRASVLVLVLALGALAVHGIIAT
jgi:hypothetical protein